MGAHSCAGGARGSQPDSINPADVLLPEASVQEVEDPLDGNAGVAGEAVHHVKCYWLAERQRHHCREHVRILICLQQALLHPHLSQLRA